MSAPIGRTDEFYQIVSARCKFGSQVFTCMLRAVRRKLIRDSLRVVRELHKFFGKLLRRESVERLAFSSALKLAQPPTSPPDLDTPKTLAATLPLPPDLSKIVKKNIAGCDTWTSHPATAELRKVRHDNFAPCDSLTSHPATSRYHTLPLSPVAPCDSKSQLSTP